MRISDWRSDGCSSELEAPMPPGARMEMLVADPAEWDQSLATVAPDAVICALGTTWRKAGRDEAAFRAVDQDLVLRVARAAKDAGVSNSIGRASCMERGCRQG